MRLSTSSTLGAATFVATFLFAPLAKGFETYQPYYQRDLARLSLAELLGEFSTRELAELLARARPPVNAQPANTPAAPSEPQATPAGDPFTPPAPLASPNKEDDDLVWKHRFHGEATFRLRPQLVSDLTAAVARIQAACRPIIAAYNKMIKEPGVGRPRNAGYEQCLESMRAAGAISKSLPKAATAETQSKAQETTGTGAGQTPLSPAAARGPSMGLTGGQGMPPQVQGHGLGHSPRGQ